MPWCDLPFGSAFLSLLSPHKDCQFSSPWAIMMFQCQVSCHNIKDRVFGPSGCCILQEFQFPWCCCWHNYYAPGCCLCPSRTSRAVSLIVQPENPSRLLEGEAGKQPHSPGIFLAAFIIQDKREKVFTLISASVFTRSILPVRNICPAWAWWRITVPVPSRYLLSHSVLRRLFAVLHWTTALAPQHEKF